MIKLADRLVKALSPSRLDPFGLGQAVWDYWREALTQPNRLLSANLKLAADQVAIASYGARRALGLEAQAPVETPKGDRRFAYAGWDEKLFFDLLKQSYLVTSRHILDQVSHGKAGNRSRHKLAFFTRQALDAISPSNFPLTNPEVLDATLKSNGTNLIQGMRNLLADLSAGNGRLKVRMVDETKFEVGRNLATAPGKVVFENELMQLIQFAPTTDMVFERPLLIIPPWINKYYILDLSPENSFIRWMVDKGYTVFVVSWVNPGKALSRKTFEDYLNEGVMAALDAVGRATGKPDVSAMGHCIGGTLLACALAVMAATGDKRIRNATFLTSQVDFTEAGDLLAFIDDYQLDQLEKRMARQGYLDSRDLATTFNLLRANDLIWSFVVNNYLLGQTPKAFDLLYWNGDSTRMPLAMHTYYLREMYLHNRLAQPGALNMNGVPIDLRKIRIPVFLQSSREDHIAPYPSVYKATHHFSGPVTFMLAGSGHTAGVINPPTANKYNHYTNEETPDDVADWIAGAEQHAGSWWPYWHRWLSRRSGRKVPARVPGSGGLPAIEDAPGRYVQMK